MTQTPSEAAVRELGETIEFAYLELAALTPFPKTAHGQSTEAMWPGMTNPADRQCVMLAFNALKDARVSISKLKGTDDAH